jgi:hypothetical protein
MKLDIWVRVLTFETPGGRLAIQPEWSDKAIRYDIRHDAVRDDAQQLVTAIEQSAGQ